MRSQPLAVARTGGLLTAADTIVAPDAAFARLREAPTWVWAYLIAVALSMLGTLAIGPALQHALATGLPAQLAGTASIAKLPPDQQQKAIAGIVATQTTILGYAWLFPPLFILLVAFVQSGVMVAANALGRGSGTFRTLWALAINVQVAGAIGGLVTAAIVLVRGSNSFERTNELQAALPNLAMIVPGAPPVAAAFLTALNVAALWQTALLGLGMIAVARIARVPAWSAAALMLLSLGAFAAFGAGAQPHRS